MAASFSILHNRKRAFIALIHSVFFLGLAARDLAVSARLPGVIRPAEVKVGSIVLVCIYMLVSGILLGLLIYSAGLLERMYFAFCTASATSGLIRAIVGDASFSAGQYLRVGMLLCAVFTGLILLRLHSTPVPETASGLAQEG